LGAISIKQLLEAGVHFGHQTGRWNPKMKSFIFGKRNGVHIIDLQKTLQLFKEAVDFLTQLAAQGKTVLFVGTKSQAQETIEEEARRCGMYWVNNRWLGGLLTNFPTVQNSIKRYRELESMRDNGHYDKLSKKEVARLERERKKFEKNLLGIKDIDRCPDALFVVDSKQESIAIQEAAKLKIPIVAIVDTNSDPDLIDYLIPGNDDALRAIKLFAGTMADAILAGKSVYSTRVEAEMKEAQEKAAKEAAQRQAAKEAKEAVQRATQEKEAVEISSAQPVAEEKTEVEIGAVKTGAAPAEEKSGEEKGTEAEGSATAAAAEPAAPAEAPAVEDTIEVKPTPAQEMKEEEKKEAPKKKKKTGAKKAKSEAKQPKSTQAAKEKKPKKKSEKTASKIRKTASAKSKSTKSPAKSKALKETASKESSVASSSSS
jgi:small subunit ribosomal protein S2